MTRARLIALIAIALVGAGYLFTDSEAGRGILSRWGLVYSAEGQVIVPLCCGAGGFTDDTTMAEITLWEYSDKQKHVTTGKSITFRIPKAYFTALINRHGGPQSRIYLTFNLANDRPWLVGGAGANLPEGAAGNALHRSRRVDVNLSTHGFVNRILSLMEVENGKAIPASIGISRATRLSGSHCGFELFDTNEPWTVGHLAHGKIFDPQISQVPPFNRAKLLARPRSDGAYAQIVSCPPATLEYPWCATSADFEGWPMVVHFSGEHVCQLDQILAQTRSLLESFVIERTERRPGEVENRNTSANKRGALNGSD